MADKFDFQKRLGSGNFGEVWLAHDRALGVERAVKVIPPGRLANPKNLFQESQILMSAQHANVVRVEDAGTLDDGRVYISMEYLKRGSAEDEASGAFMPLRRAKRVMIDALRGLAYAHSRGIVHRDIKPANIMIGNTGAAKLSDFGLAMATAASGGAMTPKEYAYIAHLAPELIDNTTYSVKHTAFSQSTDIYAAGVTLYRLVNGDAFFSKYPPAVLVRMIKAGDFPDRGAHRLFVPTPLIRVIEKAVAFKPADRFASADDFRHALERVELAADWERQRLPSGVQWSGKSDSASFEVELTEADDGWAVSVRKDRGAGYRRVQELGRTGLEKERAKKHLRKVLQKITSGRM